MKTAKQLQEEVSAAYAAGDMPRMFACFAEDCVVREAPGLPFGGEWVGHDGMRAMFALMAEHFQMEATLLDVYEASPSTVILHTMMRMTSRSGETVDMPVLEVFNCLDGRIVEAIPFYWDGERLARMAAGERTS
jgi:ketosteroid isomerase-like protein